MKKKNITTNELLIAAILFCAPANALAYTVPTWSASATDEGEIVNITGGKLGEHPPWGYVIRKIKTSPFLWFRDADAADTDGFASDDPEYKEAVPLFEFPAIVKETTFDARFTSEFSGYYLYHGDGNKWAIRRQTSPVYVTPDYFAPTADVIHMLDYNVKNEGSIRVSVEAPTKVEFEDSTKLSDFELALLRITLGSNETLAGDVCSTNPAAELVCWRQKTKDAAAQYAKTAEANQPAAGLTDFERKYIAYTLGADADKFLAMDAAAQKDAANYSAFVSLWHDEIKSEIAGYDGPDYVPSDDKDFEQKLDTLVGGGLDHVANKPIVAAFAAKYFPSEVGTLTGQDIDAKKELIGRVNAKIRDCVLAGAAGSLPDGVTGDDLHAYVCSQPSLSSGGTLTGTSKALDGLAALDSTMRAAKVARTLESSWASAAMTFDDQETAKIHAICGGPDTAQTESALTNPEDKAPAEVDHTIIADHDDPKGDQKDPATVSAADKSQQDSSKSGDKGSSTTVLAVVGLCLLGAAVGFMLMGPVGAVALGLGGALLGLSMGDKDDSSKNSGGDS